MAGQQNYQGFNMNQPQEQNQGGQYYYNPPPQEPENIVNTEIPMQPLGKNARPFVDPNAEGEVDPTSYPEPKESTHKIRGRSDILEMLCTNVSQELLIAKTFYFFFFSAFGSLFPLMAVYFKQMGLNPGQTGILIGCRPFVEFVATPFWGSIAEKFQKGKFMLLCSVAAWIIFTLSVGFVQPPATSCVVFNGTHHILRDPYTESSIRKKRSVEQIESFEGSTNVATKSPFDLDLPVLPHLYHKRSVNLEDNSIFVEEKEPIVRDVFSKRSLRRSKRDTPLPPNHVVGKSPNVVHYTVNFADFNEAEDWLSPPFSSIVYRESDVQKVFFLLLLLVILGEFFSCPAITLADTAVLNYLGDEADQYGSQRMFGSLGWGLSMFFVGIVLDHSTAFPGHPCGPHEKERNYTICFAVFSVLMGCAFVTATQFKFENVEPVSNTIPMEEQGPVDSGPRPWNEPKIPMLQTKTQRQKFDEAIGTIKTRIYANTMKEMPEWMVVLREFKTVRLSAFLFVAWWMGFGIGLIFSFLFWHLQDYGGTPTVFGIASVINHISEIFAYFFSFRLIAQIGHVKVLCIGLLGNVLRFLYISVIQNPWWVLPFEFIQGMTHAAVWAACCSYVAHNTKPELRGSSQGVLQGIHHGFGRGAGAIIGGIFVNYFGTSSVFRAYGVLSLVVLGVFVFLNFYRKDVGFQHELPPEEDPRQMAEEGTALAPHGVPHTNPLGRAHSSQKLNEMGDQSSGYGTYGNNGTLDVPGGGGSTTNNPFVGGGGGGGGGDGYNQYAMDVTGGVNPLISGQINPLAYPPSNPFRDEILGDALYNYKGSPISSPVLGEDYDSIKNRFQAYNDLLRDFSDGKLKEHEGTEEAKHDITTSQQHSEQVTN